MMRRRDFVTGLTAAVVIGGFVRAARAATSLEGAAKFVEWLAGQALATLQSQNGTLAQREASFRALLRQGFDLKLIGRFVLGRSYRTATPEQRSEFQSLFEEFLLKSYSSRMGGYKGESFQIIKAIPAGDKDALVRTRIQRPSGPPLQADWRVRARGDQYRIIDIMVGGVSMALTQRSEFEAVIKRGGMNGLLTALRARVQKYSVASSG